MRRFAFIASIALGQMIIPAHGGDTNVLIIPDNDRRPGATFFVDECLTRALTNSIPLNELRQWATNTLQRYQRASSSAVLIRDQDVPESVKSIHTRIPSCRSEKPNTEKIPKWQDLLELYSKNWGVSTNEADKRLRTIGPEMKPPNVGLLRSPSGAIQAVNISWYLYGIIVGPDSFRPSWEPTQFYFYHRKLGDGVHLWYRYK